MSRSDRKPRTRMEAEDRRDAILTAANAAFGAQPYSEVKIAAIAEAAGASDALVYKYFNGKEDLYAAVVKSEIDDLAERQEAVLAGLHAQTPVYAKVRALLDSYLDHIVESPVAWALPQLQGGTEPPSVTALRVAARAAQVDRLRSLLAPSDQPRHEIALWGFFGFVDAACLRWVETGADPNLRWPIIEAAVGALQGALGDWAA